ncbi:MAG: hypothetical protein ACRDPT_00465 [Streptomycetales bacterium]
MGDVASSVRGLAGLRAASALIMLVMSEAPISGETPIFDELVAAWKQAFRYEPTADFWSEPLPDDPQSDGEAAFVAGREPGEPASADGAGSAGSAGSRVARLSEEMPTQRVVVKRAIENRTKQAE